MFEGSFTSYFPFFWPRAVVRRYVGLPFTFALGSICGYVLTSAKSTCNNAVEANDAHVHALSQDAKKMTLAETKMSGGYH